MLSHLTFKIMKTKNVLLFSVVLFVGLMSGCNKDTVMNSGEKPAVFSSGTLIEKSASLKPGISTSVVNLGVAGDFVILSNSGISDVSSSAITGNIGTYFTGASITATDGNICDEVTGTIYTIDATGPACRLIDASKLLQASSDMGTAYTDAAGRPTSLGLLDMGAGNIGGLTLKPGVYTWGTAVTLPFGTNVTLKGTSNDVFIFQVAQTLTTGDATQIILTGGVQAKNIFWTVGQTVALGAGSQFQGNILGAKDITLLSGAAVTGRLMAGTDVTLITNVVTQPVQNKGKSHK